MSSKVEKLCESLKAVLGNNIQAIQCALGEVTVDILSEKYQECMTVLRDDPSLSFEQLMDLCGVDFSTYGQQDEGGGSTPKSFAGRYCAVSHLLSLKFNWRLRVRCFAPNDDFPVVPSVVDIWNSANWFEREAFDLYGIVFNGHPDLRRLLTDYGFVGHPFRKDFPVSGHVEMAYDPALRRVVYQPVTIEAREITPRTIRETFYGDSE